MRLKGGARFEQLAPAVVREAHQVEGADAAFEELAPAVVLEVRQVEGGMQLEGETIPQARGMGEYCPEAELALGTDRVEARLVERARLWCL